MRGSRGCRPGASRGESPVGRIVTTARRRAGRGSGGGGPAGLVVVAFLLSVLGVGAATLWRSEVAPALTGEVEEIICRVGALITGGPCPDDGYAGKPSPVLVDKGTVIPHPQDDPTFPKCTGWVRDPFLDTNAAGKRVVVAEAWIECDDTVEELDVVVNLYRLRKSSQHDFALLGGNASPERIHTRFAKTRFEYECGTGNPRQYRVLAIYTVVFAEPVVVGDTQYSFEIPVDCDD